MKRNLHEALRLSSELEAILKERRVYTSDFLNAAIAFAMESGEFKKKWLQQELQKGLDQLERGESYALEEVMNEVHGKRSSWQKSKSVAKHAQI